MELHIKTLTPLWTGGVNGKADRIYESGILGSLRWWYEAIVRGLGGTACDPSQDDTCRFDAGQYNKSQAGNERQRLRDAGLCDVCQVFGATGWKRRFRLEVTEDHTQPIWTEPDKMLNVRPPNRSRGWYLPPGRMGRFSIKIISDSETVSLLTACMLFLEKYGSIGAKPQLGYGFFQILNSSEIQEKAEHWEWGKISESRQYNAILPNLNNFLFFSYRFHPENPGWWTRVPGISRVASSVQEPVSHHKIVPVAPSLKNEWRFSQWKGSRVEAQEIFGAIRPQRKRSRVAVSWAYKLEPGEWKIKGWAWLPSGQKPAYALWGIISQEKIWKKIIGVRGNLKIYPERIFNQSQKDSVLKKFLEEATT